MGSILDVLPRAGVLFAGRTGAVPLPGGRYLLVTPDSSAVVDSVDEPPDNDVPAPDEAAPSRRPAYLDEYPLFGGLVPARERTFAELWPLRREPDDYVYRDPYTGGLIRVAQAFRAAAAEGVVPAALSYRLTFGDPADPEVAYQMKAAIQGLADAAQMLQAPFVAGELSSDVAIGLRPEVEVRAHPLPDERSRPPRLRQGDVVALVGRMTDDLGGSLYAGQLAGFPPPIDLVMEGRVLEVVRSIGRGQPLARGGLLLTLAWCCGQARLGARLTLPAAWHNLKPAAVLYGEAQSRFLVFLPPHCVNGLRELAAPLGLAVETLGMMGGQHLEIENVIKLKVEDLQ